MSIAKKSAIPLPYKVQYVFLKEVSNFNKTHQVYVGIALYGGKAWKDFYTTPGSIDFSEKSALKAPGNFYAYSLKMSFPSIDHETEARFFQLNNTRCILQLFFTDGSIRIMGTKEVPVRLITESSQTNGTSAIVISADIQSPEKARFVVKKSDMLPPPVI